MSESSFKKLALFFFFFCVGGILIFNALKEHKRSFTLYKAPIAFEKKPTKLPLPKSASYAEKRGFGDFNNDGIEDMYEIEDKDVFGQNYEVRVFKGEYKKAEGADSTKELLHFSNEVTSIPLPVTVSWFSNLTKIDVADVNGDGYADVIFSEYRVSNTGKEDLFFAYSLNQAGKSFASQKTDFSLTGEQTFLQALLGFIHQGNSYSNSEESVSDYLKMDWGDMNGDGNEDFVMFWRQYENLHIEVFYANEKGKVGFDRTESYSVNKTLKNRFMRGIDLEDFTGDGKQDILIRHDYKGEESIVNLLVNTGEGFDPHNDFSLNTHDFDLFGFEKYDSFDIDKDGKADFIHLGKMDDKKFCSFNLNQYPKTEL